MSFNSIFNKGVDFLNKSANNIKDKAIEKKSQIDEFNLLITRSEHLSDLFHYEARNSSPSIGREQKILSLGITVNVPKAKLINGLIPVEETICNIKTAKESKTEIEYWFIITNKKLWILNEKEYTIREFEDIKTCEIVNNSVMSQYVNFNGNAFQFDGTQSDISKFCEILTDTSIRDSIINTNTEYLCGVTPKTQFLNKYLTGMTIGVDESIVFHNGINNKKVTKDEIDHLELLMDNTLVMTKCKRDFQNIVSSLSECRKMTLKVVLHSEIFLIDILPQNIMGTLVKREDSLYQENYNFAVEIMNKLSELLGR